jgi:hypothetical protein
MKKMITFLAAFALVLALAPTAQAAPITITSAIVSSDHGRGVPDGGPAPKNNAALYNGVGMSGTAPDRLHDGADANHWLSAQNGQAVEDVTILFDLGSIEDVASMKIWNFYEPYTTIRGVKDLEITYGTTLTAGVIDSPTTVTSVTQFDQAIHPGAGGSITGVTYDFDDGSNGTNNARYILFSVATSYGTEGGYVDGNFVGLDEVQFFAIPEPATMSLLAIGGIALIRRRRRA